MPLQAIDRQGDKTSVMVVDACNKIEERPVTLGIQNAGHAEILSGLAEGEQVVVSDRGALKAGQAVQPKTVELTTYEGKS